MITEIIFIKTFLNKLTFLFKLNIIISIILKDSLVKFKLTDEHN